MLLTGYTVIYGGSFDPPHLSHQITCLYLLEGLAADAVWIVPANNHPFGKVLTPFPTRRRMCELLAEPFGDKAQVLSVEHELGGAGRTYDTLVHLIAQYPDKKFALAIGADIIADTPKWHRWADIEKLVRVVTIGRSGYRSTAAIDLPAIASRNLRPHIAKGGDPTGLIPARIVQFIVKEGLYQP